MLTKIHRIQDSYWARIISKYSFYMAVIIEVLVVLIDKSNYINPIEGRLFQLTFVLCCIKLLFTKFDYREYLVIFLFVLLGLWIDISGDRNEILRAFIFVAACKDMDMKKTLKLVFVIMLGGTLAIMLLSLTGIYGNLAVLKEYPNGEFVRRYAFGMGNANAFHCIFFVLVLLGLYVFENEMKWWIYLCLIIGDILLFVLTDSTTSMALVILTVVLMASKKLLNRKNYKILGISCLIADLSLPLLSVFFASQAYKIYEYNWSRIPKTPYIEFLVLLNKILTGRILFLMNYESRAGSISTWRLGAVKEHTEFFDLGFVRMFYWYGIIPTVIILLVFGLLCIYLYRKSKYSELLFISLIALYTLVEAHFVSEYIGRCYPLFILGGYWCELLRKGSLLKDEKK